MSELKLLLEAFERFKIETDLPAWAYVEDIPNLGEIKEFINAIRNENEFNQAIFLKELIDREETWPRLLELTGSDDIDARITAHLALLKTSYRPDSKPT